MNATENTAAPATAQQIQFALLRLTNWPDIPQLPAQDMVDMARICALLSWRATAGVIIPRILGIPKERTQEILQMLQAQGCLNIHTEQPAVALASSTAAANQDSASGDVDEPPANSFITKIWQRLAARN